MVGRFASVLGAFLSLTACTSVRVIDDRESRPEPPDDPPACEIPQQDLVTISTVRSATLMGDVLHLEASVDGVEAYALLDVSVTPAVLIDSRPDLLGGARWTPLEGGQWARVRGLSLEVLDASDPFAPSLTTGIDLDGALVDGWAGVWSTSGRDAYLCQWSEADAASFLTRVSVDANLLERLENTSCDATGEHGDADAGLWVSWWEGGAVRLYDLVEAHGIDSHSFAIDGVHQYGAITAVATDDAISAITMENESYAFLYYADQPQFVVYSSFGGGEKQLLDVVEGQAIVAFPGDHGPRVQSFDLDPPPAPEAPAAQGALSATLQASASAVSELRALSSSGDRVVVSDGDGVYLINLASQGEVGALQVARSGDVTCGP